MKKAAALLAAIAAAVLLFAACAPSAAVLYENDFDDLDIEGRCDDVVSMAKHGFAGSYEKGALEQMKKDLLAIEPSDKRLIEVNHKFIASIDMLIEYLESVDEHDTDTAGELLTGAQELFTDADRELNSYKRELMND